MSTEVIQSDRLDLVWLSPEFIEALLAGGSAVAEQIGGFALPADWPNDHDARFLAFRLKQAREDPTQSPWLVRAIVLRGPERSMIGHIGFHGGPGRNARKEPDAVRSATASSPSTGAVATRRRPCGRCSTGRGRRASTASSRPSARRTSRRCTIVSDGFREVGRHWDDEDGEELEFELSAERGPLA